MHATTIDRAELTALATKPVVIQGVQQQTLRELTRPADATVNGVLLRLPAGCVVSILGDGVGGPFGTLESDITFVGRDGQTWRAVRGMRVQFPRG